MPAERWRLPFAEAKSSILDTDGKRLPPPDSTARRRGGLESGLYSITGVDISPFPTQERPPMHNSLVSSFLDPDSIPATLHLSRQRKWSMGPVVVQYLDRSTSHLDSDPARPLLLVDAPPVTVASENPANLGTSIFHSRIITRRGFLHMNSGPYCPILQCPQVPHCKKTWTGLA